MSYGFKAHSDFVVVAAADRQNAKPSSGVGSLECNQSYERNIGIKPANVDLASMAPHELGKLWGIKPTEVDVLISCAPCTGFSRTVRKSLVEDDPRNNLVRGTSKFVEYFQPRVLVMENVQELLNGKFNNHFHYLEGKLHGLGYTVHSALHSLNLFGVPQRRVRALIIAVKSPVISVGMEDLWAGYSIAPEATTVRRAISALTVLKAVETDPNDRDHVSPSMSKHSLERLKRIPSNGGSWPDLLNVRNGRTYLIPSMAKHADVGKVGPYRDIYGRLWWDRPSVTIKRECSSPGNGRYCHPEQDRLCSIREMGILQGFPTTYQFVAKSMANRYRHVGDAVPPLFSYQVAHLVKWMLTGVKPEVIDLLLGDTHLTKSDIRIDPSYGDRPLEQARKSVKIDSIQSDLFNAGVDSHRSNIQTFCN